LALSAFTALSGSLAISTAISPAMADDYPSRPIRLIIPFPPGGSNDVVGRIVANQLGQKLGQTVFVDNRAGAGGVVGTDVAAKSAADGYTLLVVSLAHAVDPWIYQETFDPIKDFVPVAILATGTNVLTVNPNVPVHSVKELIDLAKAKPGFLNYASAGIGSFQNLGGELFKVLAGVNIVHVPYKGGGPSMLAVIAGEAQMMFSSIVQTVSNIQAGGLRPLATGGAPLSAKPFEFIGYRELHDRPSSEEIVTGCQRDRGDHDGRDHRRRARRQSIRRAHRTRSMTKEHAGFTGSSRPCCASTTSPTTTRNLTTTTAASRIATMSRCRASRAATRRLWWVSLRSCRCRA